MTKSRKNTIVVIERKHTWTGLNFASKGEHSSYQLAKVLQADKQGTVKAVKILGWKFPIEIEILKHTVYTIDPPHLQAAAASLGRTVTAETNNWYAIDDLKTEILGHLSAAPEATNTISAVHP
jgi:hypothetical protein